MKEGVAGRIKPAGQGTRAPDSRHLVPSTDGRSRSTAAARDRTRVPGRFPAHQRVEGSGAKWAGREVRMGNVSRFPGTMDEGPGPHSQSMWPRLMPDLYFFLLFLSGPPNARCPVRRIRHGWDRLAWTPRGINPEGRVRQDRATGAAGRATGSRGGARPTLEGTVRIPVAPRKFDRLTKSARQFSGTALLAKERAAFQGRLVDGRAGRPPSA